MLSRNTFNQGTLSYVFHQHYKEDTKNSSRLMREKMERSQNMYQMDLKAHFGCVNAIEFSNGAGEYIASGGDDKRVLLWNVQRALSAGYTPAPMKGEHHSNIFCLAFDSSNKNIFSGGNDQAVIVHDAQSGELVDVFLHQEAVYGLSVDPSNDNVFASACDDGRILLYDIREPPEADSLCLCDCSTPMHAVMHNPIDPRLIATANSKEGIGLWDVRVPKECLMHYGGKWSQQSCMSVRFNSLGDRLTALRRRLPPVLYDVRHSAPLCQFDHVGYYNSCTMKSCCFAGDQDQYLVSGSDDFSLYIWRIPDKGSEKVWLSEAHLVLKGHRSIVNQVRFNPDNHLLISSGVEKVIKAWSPFPIGNAPRREEDASLQNFEDRLVYSHEEYINLVLQSGQVMTHDYTNESVEEDPRMMAFFDSLVQRELEGWSSDSNSSTDLDAFQSFVQSSHSEPSDLDADAGVDADSDEERFSPFTQAFAGVIAESVRREAGGGGEGGGDGEDEVEGEQGSSSQHRLNEALNEAGRELFAEEAVQRLRTGRNQENEAASRKRTITELIAERRKDYWANIVKYTASPEQSNKLVKRRRKRRSKSESNMSDTLGLTQTDSDSSESEVQPSCGNKKSTLHLPDSDSDSALSGPSNRDIAFKQREMPTALGRLKRLRARVLLSDSDSETSDGEQNGPTTTSTPVLKNGNFNIGEKNLTNGEKCEKNHFSTDVVQENSEENQRAMFTDNEQKIEPKLPNGSDSTAISSVLQYNNNSSNSNGAENGLLCSTNGNITASCSTSRDEDDTSSQPVWTRFKKYKSKMEKARRHYRTQKKDTKAVSSDEDNNDPSTEQ